MNTGTADAPSVEAVGAYLGEFLMDPAIIGAPKLIRKLIVKHIVRNRPARTVANYQEFWTPEGSPFIIGSRLQAQRLEEELGKRLGAQNVKVELGMRYGNPSTAGALESLRSAGCDSLIILPSYPQEVNVCAGTCIRHAHEELDHMDWHPQVVEVPSFHKLPSYRKALAAQVDAEWQHRKGAKLIVSYHSTMLADIEAGDPYRDQTLETAHSLAQDLSVPEEDLVVSYQSRFDSRKWLQPFTEPTVRELARKGVKDICIVCPIFTVDNMETSLEVNRDLRKIFLEEAGAGASFTYVPALGAGDGIIATLADACQKALDGEAATSASKLKGATADTSVPHMLKHD